MWETSAFAAFRPTKNGGREAVLKTILFHTAVSRSQTLLIIHSTLTIDTVALATASQGHFSVKLLTSYQGYFQITASHRDLCGSGDILHLSRTCLMKRCDGHTTILPGNWALKPPSPPSDSNSLQANVSPPHNRTKLQPAVIERSLISHLLSEKLLALNRDL